jgi:hypothetical protein
MKLSILIFPGIGSASVRCLLLTAALVAAGIGGASAQQPPAKPSAVQSPPAAVSGWRYERGQSDLHIFRCEQTKCGAGSRVSYQLFAPGKPMTLEEFRGSQERVVKALEQRTPGLKATIIGVDGDKGNALPRLFKARRLTVAPGGASEYVVSALLFGTRASASLISSAREEKASSDNYTQFALAMALFVQAPAAR